MKKIIKQNAEKILGVVASQIGRTDWYFNLHFYRFVHIINIILKRKSSVKKEIALELGVWPGYMALSLHEIGFDLRGIDLDFSRIRQISSQIKIVDYNLDKISPKIPYPDNYFDYIIASEIIEHIKPDNLPGLFIEINRLLNKNGLVVLTTPNKNSLHNLIFSKKYSSDKLKNGHGHAREYSLSELHELINQSPLILTKFATVNFYSNIGKLSQGKYFYPLKDFWNYPNKLFNLFKFFLMPLKHISILRDSIILLIQKND